MRALLNLTWPFKYTVLCGCNIAANVEDDVTVSYDVLWGLVSDCWTVYVKMVPSVTLAMDDLYSKFELLGVRVAKWVASQDSMQEVQILVVSKTWKWVAEMEFVNNYLIWVGPMLKLCVCMLFKLLLINLSYGIVANLELL